MIFHVPKPLAHILEKAVGLQVPIWSHEHSECGRWWPSQGARHFGYFFWMGKVPSHPSTSSWWGQCDLRRGNFRKCKGSCKPWIHGYLMPLLIRMAEVDGKPQPFVDPLRDEISSLYKLFSKQVEDPQVVFDPWMTRKFLWMVKAKARKEQPSTDPFLRLYSIHYVVVFVLLALYIYNVQSVYIVQCISIIQEMKRERERMKSSTWKLGDGYQKF